MKHHLLSAVVLFLVLQISPLHAAADKTIIHRLTGAQLSLPALLLAGLQHADFIELPVVLTRDDKPLVFDELVLQETTNVAEIFPERGRADGTFHVIDFTLEEIMQLRYTGQAGEQSFTAHPTGLDDALLLLTRLQTLAADVPRGLPVVKFPWFHAGEGKDISNLVLKSLIAHSNAETVLHLKCFDPEELQRIHKELLPGLPLEVRLIQGVDAENGSETMRLQRETWSSYRYEWLFTRLGLRVAAGYASALSLKDVSRVDNDTLRQLIADSQALKMQVFVDVPGDQSQAPQALYDDILFVFNADGVTVNDPAPLIAYLQERHEIKSAAPLPENTDAAASADSPVENLPSHR